MDRRKLEQFKKQQYESSDEMNIQKIINSSKINEALIQSAASMFDLEFILKQKAQLKFLQVKQMDFSQRSKFLSVLDPQFLWQPTPIFYLATLCGFVLAKRWIRLQWLHFIPCLVVPATFDFFKREHYVKLHKKEYDEFMKADRMVRQILREKKQYVTLEQVLGFCFHLSLDSKVDQRKLLPISYL